jgi:hypothetical protein
LAKEAILVVVHRRADFRNDPAGTQEILDLMVECPMEDHSAALNSTRATVSPDASISRLRPICAILTCMSGSSTSDKRALNILSELHAAEKELVGKAVVLTDGKAGTIDHVYLDDVHGLRISISGHEGRWPISTVKHIES